MRGTVQNGHSLMQPRGITPAHAGNRLGMRNWGIRSKDHPRACGEQNLSLSSSSSALGSPPRMRGTAYVTTYFFTMVRITPAHAGNRYRSRGRLHEG